LLLALIVSLYRNPGEKQPEKRRSFRVMFYKTNPCKRSCLIQEKMNKQPWNDNAIKKAVILSERGESKDLGTT